MSKRKADLRIRPTKARPFNIRARHEIGEFKVQLGSTALVYNEVHCSTSQNLIKFTLRDTRKGVPFAERSRPVSAFVKTSFASVNIMSEKLDKLVMDLRNNVFPPDACDFRADDWGILI